MRAARSCSIGSALGQVEDDGAELSASKSWPYISTSDAP